MLSPEELRAILNDVTYKDGWELVLGLPAPDAGTPYLKWVFTAPDIHSGEPEIQHCRKWQLSYHMTNSELVRTAYKAVLAAEEHEAAEAFHYKNVMVYNPHMNVEQLALRIHTGDVSDDYR
jgi:hypothetical protein